MGLLFERRNDTGTIFECNWLFFQKQVQGNGGIRLKNLAFATEQKARKISNNGELLPIPYSLFPIPCPRLFPIPCPRLFPIPCPRPRTFMPNGTLLRTPKPYLGFAE